MKRITLILVAILMTTNLFAQSQRMRAMIDFKTFATDKLEPYIEFIFYVGGKSVNYVPTDGGKFNAEVMISAEVKKQDSVVAALRYVLVSDNFEDSVKATKPDFSDIRNLQVPNGNYEIYFYMTDLHGNGDTLRYIDNVVVNFPEDAVSMSQISLLSDVKYAQPDDFYVKYNYALTPIFHDYVPESIYALSYILEIYNTDKTVGPNEELELRTYIQGLDGKVVTLPGLLQEKTFKTAPVSVLMNQFAIYNLPSGNYFMVAEVFKGETIYAQEKTFFQRSNPGLELVLADYTRMEVESTFVENIKDTAQLIDYVSSLFPISSMMEQEFLSKRMKNVPFDQLQRFFYYFWVSRAPENPEKAWNEYNEKVKLVNKTYGNKVIRGYLTDRGRVYLRYGAPNTIYESPYDSHSYPYEIWHYYYLEDQSNVKFIFYNTDLVSNDYELLHSDKFGEYHDSAWQSKLTLRKTTPIYNFDVNESEDYWGNHTKEDWKYLK